MGRKSVWEEEENSWVGKAAMPGPMTVLEQIPVAEKKKSSWSSQGPQMVVTFRGVPAELHEQVKKLADDLGVAAGEVARFLLEFSLGAVVRGELRLDPTLAEGRRTLFPPEGWGASSYIPVGTLPRRKRTKGKAAPKVSYRGIPEGTTQQVEELAGRLVVPIGELARRLLEFGLEAYRAGKLPMQTYAVITKNTLYG